MQVNDNPIDVIHLQDSQSLSLFEEIYYCENIDICLMKYICGGVSLVFVILYGIALTRIRKYREMLELDLKDRILLFLALGESVSILLYHILFSHPIFLFIIRIAKMLE